MKATTRASDELRSRREAPTWALLLGALLTLAAWIALSPPGANDLVGGDEGYYGVMARNLLASRAQWAFPSLTPLGPPGDKPPLEPALIAASVRALGATPTAVRIPNLLAALVTLLATARLARRLAGANAAWCALALLATLPWYADATRWASGEAPLTALGMLALGVLAGGTRGADRALGAGRAFGAGALLGLAFLAKLWLVAPLVFAALLALPREGRVRATLALAAGAALPALAHLALAWATLGAAGLACWRDVVLGFSLASRVGGEGYAEYWRHGPAWYVTMLAKAFAAASPLVLAGTFFALRRVAQPFARLPLAAWLGLALLSVFRVKAGGYLQPLVPLVVLLAATGFAELRARTPLLAFLLAAAAAGVGGAQLVRRLPYPVHDTGYRDVCVAVLPRLANARVTDVAIVAPEAPVFAFHTFRRAEYWDTPYQRWDAERFAALANDPTRRVFVIDPDRRTYGGWPDSATVTWLEAHTREVSGEIARRQGEPLGLRVFVRE